MTKRAAQANQLIHTLLADIMTRELELPAGVILTISKVEVSDNLKYAKVWLVISPSEQVGKAYGLVRKNLPMLQAELADQLQTQFSPRLQLRLDRDAGKLGEVERLLAEIAKEKRN